MKQLLRYFAQGALIAVPIAMTLYVVFASVRAVDSVLDFGVPGLGLVFTLGTITLLGFTASSVVGTRMVALTDAALGRLPLVKILYSAMKDLVGAFVGEKKSFNRPVRVTLPGGLGCILGFQTQSALPIKGLQDHVAVYFPQSYNFAGNLLIIPADQVTPIDVKSSELMSFIISGGVAALSSRPQRNSHPSDHPHPHSPPVLNPSESQKLLNKAE